MAAEASQSVAFLKNSQTKQGLFYCFEVGSMQAEESGPACPIVHLSFNDLQIIPASLWTLQFQALFRSDFHGAFAHFQQLGQPCAYRIDLSAQTGTNTRFLLKFMELIRTEKQVLEHPSVVCTAIILPRKHAATIQKIVQSVLQQLKGRPKRCFIDERDAAEWVCSTLSDFLS